MFHLFLDPTTSPLTTGIVLFFFSFCASNVFLCIFTDISPDCKNYFSNLIFFQDCLKTLIGFASKFLRFGPRLPIIFLTVPFAVCTFYNEL